MRSTASLVNHNLAAGQSGTPAMRSYVAQKNQAFSSAGQEQELYFSTPSPPGSCKHVLWPSITLLTSRTALSQIPGLSKVRNAQCCPQANSIRNCSDTHTLHTWGAKGLWKRQLLSCTLLSNMVAHSTFCVPCFLCQAHAFKLCSCSKYIWSLWNSNHTNTRKPLNWVPINYIFRNKAHGLACGVPWLPMGCCAPASAQPRAQTQQSQRATAEGHTTKYSHQLLFKQVRRHMNYYIKMKIKILKKGRGNG